MTKPIHEQISDFSSMIGEESWKRISAVMWIRVYPLMVVAYPEIVGNKSCGENKFSHADIIKISMDVSDANIWKSLNINLIQRNLLVGWFVYSVVENGKSAFAPGFSGTRCENSSWWMRDTKYRPIKICMYNSMVNCHEQAPIFEGKIIIPFGKSVDTISRMIAERWCRDNNYSLGSICFDNFFDSFGDVNSQVVRFNFNKKEN